MQGKGEKENIQWHRSQEFPNLEFIWAKNSTRLWRVYHETYTVCTPLGDPTNQYAEWVYRRNKYVSPADHIMFMEPGEIHANTKMHNPGTFQVLMINPTTIENAARELGLSGLPAIKLCNVTNPAYYHAFNRFHRSFRQPATYLERQTNLMRCIEILLNNCEIKPTFTFKSHRHDALERARDFLRERYAEKITLEELSKLSGLSRFHFLRAFSQEYGLPPHAYQISVRLFKAKTLLAKGTPLNEIEVGFADQSHFIRHFKKAFACTPAYFSHSLYKINI